MKNTILTVLLLMLSSVTVFGQQRFMVNNAYSTGPGSLAEAIRNANVDILRDTILFNPDYFSEPQTIYIPANASLPFIEQPVVIVGNKSSNGINWVTIQSELPHSTDIGLLINSYNVEIQHLNFFNFRNSGIHTTQQARSVYIEGCVLAGNRKAQIEFKRSTNLAVDRCFFGTDPSGQMKYSNYPQEIGILLDSCTTFIIGSDFENSGNVFGGFLDDAIEIRNARGGNILGNHIGVTRDGIISLENGGNGITFKENSSLCSIIGNVIVFNSENGVFLENSSDITVSENEIGFINTTKRDAPNKGSGIHIEGISTNNIIGSSSENMNTIRYNGKHGIWISSPFAQNNRIFCNDLSCNKEKGISLRDGVSLVGNNSIEAPIISSADQTNGIVGTALYPDQQISVFATAAECPSSCAGALMLGTAAINPDDMSWQLAWDDAWDSLFIQNPNIKIVALAIDENANTSEFSDCKEICVLKRTSIKPFYLCGLGDSLNVKDYFEEVNVQGGIPSLNYRWLLNDVETGTGSVLVPQEEGNYILEVSACNGYTKLSLNVQVHFIDFKVDAGPDQLIEISGGGVTLEPTFFNDELLSVSWLPETGLDTPNILNPTATPTVTTTYTLTVISKNGCIATDEVTVSIESPHRTRWGVNPSGTKKEIPASLHAYPNGNIMAVGSFNGSIEWGGETISSEANGNDVFIIMTDGDGNPRIGRKGGGMSVERVIGSTQDSKGNVWVVGTFSGTMVIAGETLVAEGPQDIFLIKLDGDGNPRIGRKGGGMSVERVAGITSDKEDNIYIAGTFSDKIAFGDMELIAQSPDEIFLFKLDGDGNPRIGRKGGGMSVERVAGIVVDKEEIIHVVGTFANRFNFQTAVNLNGTGRENLFVLSLNKNLDALHGVTSQALTADSRNSITKITTDKEGNIIVAGEVTGGFRWGSRMSYLTNPDTGDVFIAKLTPSNLQPIWGRRFTGKSAENISCLAVDKDNNIFTGGTFNDNLLLAGRPLTSKGGRDFFVTKMTPEGVIMWNSGGGGLGDDTLATITTTPEGGVYILGAVSSSSDFMDRNLDAVGETDIFIVSLTPGSTAINDIHFDSDKAQNLIVFPNPNKGQFQINLPQEVQGNLTINDLMGKSIYNTSVLKTDDASRKINLPENIHNGVYFLRFEGENGNLYGKIIVE